MALIQVTDANGNINPILAVLYMIGFALIIAVAIVFMSARGNQGSFQGYKFNKK
jgi:hypothetical protein